MSNYHSLDLLKQSALPDAPPPRADDNTLALFNRAYSDLLSLQRLNDLLADLRVKVLAVESIKDPSARRANINNAQMKLNEIEAVQFNNTNIAPKIKDAISTARQALTDQPPPLDLPNIQELMPVAQQPTPSYSAAARGALAEHPAKSESNLIPDRVIAVRQESTLFQQYCGADNESIRLNEDTEVDYLALKRMLINVVRRQNEALYRGAPAMTLSTLNLTSKFQLIIDVQAGTRGIFRIVPLIVPPNTEVKSDHSHTLKLAFNGPKKKGDPHYNAKVIQNCLDRLQASSDSQVCRTGGGQLLESLIETVESNGGTP